MANNDAEVSVNEMAIWKSTKVSSKVKGMQLNTMMTKTVHEEFLKENNFCAWKLRMSTDQLTCIEGW